MWMPNDLRCPASIERSDKNAGSRVRVPSPCHLPRAHRSVTQTAMDRKHGSLAVLRYRPLQVRGRRPQARRRREASSLVEMPASRAAVCGFDARDREAA